MADRATAPPTPFVSGWSRVAATEDWPLLLGIPMLAGLFVFAGASLGWWALLAAVAVYAAGYLALTRAEDVLVTRAQLLATLARLPELDGSARPGQSERTAGYAEGIADGLGLDGETAAAVVDAARVRRVGAIGYDTTPTGRRGFDERAVARWGAHIVGHGDQMAAVAALLVPDGTSDTAMLRAVVALAAEFEERHHGEGVTVEAALAALEPESGAAGRTAWEALRRSLAAPSG